ITDSLMKNRFSCRYFLPKPVAKELVEEIIDAARYAPSATNMQYAMAKVYCLSGDFLKVVSNEMVQAHITCPEAYKAQYDYYPTNTLPEEYAIRRREFGKRFYGSLNVDHNDSAGTAAALTRQYEFFGAPVVFVFTINQALTPGNALIGSRMDLGYFLQSVTIAARARGLETTSQGSTTKFQLILRKHLPIKDTEVVALGMSMGYPDLEKVGQYYARQPKREVADIIEFHGL
ncbi:nitroreductase, partial [Dendrothele bispora CBS 962.96]